MSLCQEMCKPRSIYVVGTGGGPGQMIEQAYEMAAPSVQYTDHHSDPCYWSQRRRVGLAFECPHLHVAGASRAGVSCRSGRCADGNCAIAAQRLLCDHWPVGRCRVRSQRGRRNAAMAFGVCGDGGARLGDACAQPVAVVTIFRL